MIAEHWWSDEAHHLKLSLISYVSVKTYQYVKCTKRDNICDFMSPVLSAFRILMLYFTICINQEFNINANCIYVKCLVYKHDETIMYVF